MSNIDGLPCTLHRLVLMFKRQPKEEEEDIRREEDRNREESEVEPMEEDKSEQVNVRENRPKREKREGKE